MLFNHSHFEGELFLTLLTIYVLIDQAKSFQHLNNKFKLNRLVFMRIINIYFLKDIFNFFIIKRLKIKNMK